MIRTRIFRAMLKGRFESDASAKPYSVTTPAAIAILSAMFITGGILALTGISPGSIFALTLDGIAGLELWRVLSFGVSTFAPTPADSGSFLPSLLSSALLFGITVTVIGLSGKRAELRIGSLRLAMAGLAAVVFDAMLGLLVLRHDAAFSPVAAAFTFLTISQLARFERPDAELDRRTDACLMAGGFTLLMVMVSAAFEASFVPLVAGILIGPLVGMGVFAWVRTAEVWRLETEGTGTVGGVLFADDTELLTMEELKDMTDKLLAQISETGIDSLDRQQRQFLARASVRLKAMQAAQDEPKDVAPSSTKSPRRRLEDDELPF